MPSIFSSLPPIFKKWNIIKKHVAKPSLSLHIGHRGAAGYCPENTIASYQKAIELGVDFIEIDIQMSKDGELIVFHDETVNRTTNGQGRLKNFTYEELLQLDAGSWFHEEFKNQKILLLHEVLERFLPATGILIEIKYPYLYPGIEEKLAKELNKYNLFKSGRATVMVQSFDFDTVKRFHALMPSIPLGILLRHNPKGLSKKILVECSNFSDFINVKWTMVNKRNINQIHAHGMKVFTWTVNNHRKIESFKKMNLDGITTDFPDLL